MHNFVNLSVIFDVWVPYIPSKPGLLALPEWLSLFVMNPINEPIYKGALGSLLYSQMRIGPNLAIKPDVTLW